MSKGKLVLKPIAVFTVCFLTALLLGETWILVRGAETFGLVYRLETHYLDHPHFFWLAQSFVFGLIATAWWHPFSRATAAVKFVTAVSAVWLAVLFAALPCSLLWMFFEYRPFVLRPAQVFDLLPQGFEAAIILYITSIPLNLVGTAFAVALLFFLRQSVHETRQVTGHSLAYFKPAQSTSVLWNLVKTLCQTVVFWFSFLYLIPQILLAFERFFGFQPFRFPGQDTLAFLGFVAASIGGLWSGATMAVVGQGTPLPFDTAAKLVVAGPYRFVRNPMALFGLAQGLFVGIFLGSYFIFPYVFLGGWLWDTFVRPVEENELRFRFGADYDAYCREVSCWHFRLKKNKI